jgi:hypothetical protein
VEQCHNLQGIDGDKLANDAILDGEEVIKDTVGGHHQYIPVRILINFPAQQVVLNKRRIFLANRHQGNYSHIKQLKLGIVVACAAFISAFVDAFVAAVHRKRHIVTGGYVCHFFTLFK